MCGLRLLLKRDISHGRVIEIVSRRMALLYEGNVNDDEDHLELIPVD